MQLREVRKTDWKGGNTLKTFSHWNKPVSEMDEADWMLVKIVFTVAGLLPFGACLVYPFIE